MTPVGEDDLMAWIDDRLPPERRAMVDRYLAENPDEAVRIEAMAGQRRALGDAFRHVATEPIPAAMRVTAIRQRRSRPAWINVAAAILLLVVGFGGGWQVHQAISPPRAGLGALANEASDNFRVFANDPVQPVDMGPERKVAFVRWVSDRLGAPVAAPDLSAAGYAFTGGRLVATAHGPAALFLYRSGAGAPLGVFVRPMEIDKNAPPRAHELDGIGGLSWSRDGMGYSVATKGSADMLNGLARRIMAETT